MNARRCFVLILGCCLLPYRVAESGEDVNQELKLARYKFAEYQAVSLGGVAVSGNDLSVRQLNQLIEDAQRDIEELQVEIDKFGPGYYSGKTAATNMQLVRREQQNRLKRLRDLYSRQAPDKEDRAALTLERNRLERECKESFRVLRDAAAAVFGRDEMHQGVAAAMRRLGWQTGTPDVFGMPEVFWRAYTGYVAANPPPEAAKAPVNAAPTGRADALAPGPGRAGSLKDEDFILPVGGTGKLVNWRYTTTQPKGGWMNVAFDDLKWKEGSSPFGKTPILNVATDWLDNGTIWMRKKFVMPRLEPDDVLFVRVYHDREVKIYFNGRIVLGLGHSTATYEDHELSKYYASFLKPGENVIAVDCSNFLGNVQGIDLGIWKRKKK